MTQFFWAGYDVSGDTDNIATAYIPSGEGWHRGIEVELGTDPIANVDVFVSESEDGYAACKIYHDGQPVDGVEVDGRTYAVYAQVPS